MRSDVPGVRCSHRGVRAFGCLATVVVIAACDGTRSRASPDASLPDAPDVGAHVEDATPAAPTEPTPPESPAEPAAPIPPSTMPCPPGWVEAHDDGSDARWCEPWRAGVVAACEPGEARFPGTPACAVVGRACPSGPFPDDGVPPSARYVLAGASDADGDGTRERPFATIERALTGAAPGTTVVIGRGVYEGAVHLPAGVVLRGACAAETLVASAVPSVAEGVLTVDGADVEVRDLRVTESARPGIVIDRGSASATLRGVVVERVEGEGIAVARGRLDASDVVVRDTRVRADDSATGRAIRVSLGAHAEIRRAVIERNRWVAVGAFDAGTTLVLEDSAVLDTDRTAGGRGQGVQIASGANAAIARCVLERNRGHGVLVACNEPGCGASATLDDVVVRDTRADDGETRGRAVGVQGASATLRRVVLARYHAYGLLAYDGATVDAGDVVVLDGLSRTDGEDPGSSAIGARTGASLHVERAFVARGGDLGLLADGAAVLRAEDVVVRETGDVPSTEPFGGGGALAVDGATMELSRAQIEASVGYGIATGHEGTEVHISDVAILDTRPDSATVTGGFGLTIEDGASVELERARFERNVDMALFVLGATSALSASDIVVRETASNADGVAGIGLGVHAGSVVLHRASFERNQMLGIGASCTSETMVGCTASLDLEDVVVRDSLGLDGFGTFGRGIALHLGARAQMRRVVVAATREFAMTIGEAASLDATDLVIRDVDEAACASTSCPDEAAGTAVAVAGGSRTRIERFRITDAALCGALVAEGSEVDLVDGEIARNGIGVCVQIEGYDVSRLLTGVAFRDNARNLQATSLPLPTAIVP